MLSRFFSLFFPYSTNQIFPEKRQITDLKTCVKGSNEIDSLLFGSCQKRSTNECRIMACAHFCQVSHLFWAPNYLEMQIK